MVALLGLASVILIRVSLTNKLELELQKRGVSIAEHLAEDVVTPLLTENNLELQLIALSRKKSDQDIEYIFIESSDGRVLAHTFGQLFPTDLITQTSINAGHARGSGIRPLMTEKGRTFDISAPVLKGALATVHVGISGQPVRRSVAVIIGSVLTITAVVLLCGSILAVIFTLKITKPLSEFAKAVKTVGSGGQGQRVPVTTGDEIGRLAEAFNQMMDDLRTTTVSRAQLERLVQERTAELSEANQMLSALVRFSPLPVIGVGTDGNVHLWNPAAERLFGWREQEVLGTKNPIVPADREEEYRLLREDLQQGRTFTSREMLRQKKDGTLICLSGSAAAIRDANGGTVMLFGIFEDITGRKRAETEILRLSRQNELILTSAGEGIYGLDREGVITFINPAAAQMVGWNAADLVGRRSHETWHHTKPDGSPYPREHCPFHKALVTGAVHHIKDELFWKKNGTGFPVEYVSTPITDGGSITGAVVVFQDISERKQAEQALESAVIKAKEEKAKTESIIAAIGDGINIQDTEYRILYQNEVAVGFYGYHVGEYCYKAFQNKEQVCERCHLAIAFTDGKVHTLEQKRTTDQGTRYHEITASPLRNADGKIVAGIEIVRDVTERRKLLKQLEDMADTLAVRVQEEVEKSRAREQLMQIQSRHAAMGEMIDNIAHQWRQPLNNLGLILQGMKQKFNDGTLTPEKMQDQAKIGMSLMAYMSQTINDFTHFLRHDKAVAKFRIKDVVGIALNVAETSLKRNSISVAVDIADDIIVKGFRNEYTQVVVNILNNARDIFVERGIRKPVITLRTFREDHASVLVIADNGGGIADDVMGKIFTPYFTTKGPYRGTGIGLYMSKIIIEKNMQGRLSVCNTGDGAEFKIEVRHGG